MLAPDPLMAGSQHTPWGHTPCVPGRGWRGAVPPLTPNRNGARHERRTPVRAKVRASEAGAPRGTPRRAARA